MKLSMFIPEFLPKLRKGAGAYPADGGCFVQVSSYLWDGSWTDGNDEYGGPTDCMNGYIRQKGIELNDSLNDEKRQQMYLLIPRALGTEDLYDDDCRNENYKLETFYNSWWEQHGSLARLVLVRKASLHDDEGSSGDMAIAAFTALLDEYDRLTGRVPEPVAPERWAALAEVFVGREVRVKDGTCSLVTH